MNEDYVHISIILDRTGSMERIRDDTIGGFNTLLQEQKRESGTATLTLVQFDSQDPYEVIHQFAPIQSIPELTRQTYVPRAGTPLLDTIGRGINDLEQQLGEMSPNQSPAKVAFVIITDGQENSSQEFRKEQIVSMIQRKQERDGWQFVFLSADLGSINDARSYGFQESSSMSYDPNARGTPRAWSSLSSRISDYRGSRSNEIAFTEEDRKQQESEDKRSN